MIEFIIACMAMLLIIAIPCFVLYGILAGIVWLVCIIFKIAFSWAIPSFLFLVSIIFGIAALTK